MAIPIQIDSHSFIIPQSSDACELWTSYYDKLKQVLGKSHAKSLWLITWKQNGSQTCVIQPSFNRWMKKENLNVSNLATQSIADLSEIGQNIFGLGKSLSKVIAIGVPIVLGILLLIAISIIYRSSKEIDIQDIAMATPIGRTTKLLGS